MAAASKRVVSLNDDGETVCIHDLAIRSRALYRQLETVDDPKRAAVLLNALDTGAEVLERVGRHGELEELSRAVERLDEEAKRIIIKAAEQVDRSIEKSVGEMAENLQGNDGPFAAVLDRFDLTTEGNVIDVFRDLVSATEVAPL